MFQFSAYGKSLGNISVAQFLKLIPPTHITLEIIKPNTSTLINIIGGSVHHLEETNIENGRNEDKIKISFTTSEMYSDVKDAVLNFKNCNLCTFPNVSLVDISSDEFSSGNNPSCVSDECQSVSESLSNIIAFSLNTKFRKTCYNMFENRNGTQTIRELIQFKLSDFENKKKPLRDSDDV